MNGDCLPWAGRIDKDGYWGHLEAVTKAENRRRQVERQQVCLDGHPLPESDGKRVCKPCNARRQRESRAARRHQA